MVKLTKYQIDAKEIVTEALEVTPAQYQAQLLEVFSYLAYCAATAASQHQYLANLGDIQTLIDAAKADNVSALEGMQQQLNAEISQLRSETRSGFEKVARCLQAVISRQDALEQRVQQLEDQEPHPVMLNYHIDNSDHSTHIKQESGIRSVKAELLVLLALTCLVALLCLQQSLTVRDSWLLFREQQEVKR